MKYQHQELAAGGWQKLCLIEQLANVGSEVERAIKWKAQENRERSLKAVERALELLSLTIGDGKNRKRLKEIVRLYEVMVDYFYGGNQYGASDESWHKYFSAFAYAARLKERQNRMQKR